jgi:hypothetical protein
MITFFIYGRPPLVVEGDDVFGGRRQVGDEEANPRIASPGCNSRLAITQRGFFQYAPRPAKSIIGVPSAKALDLRVSPAASNETPISRRFGARTMKQVNCIGVSNIHGNILQGARRLPYRNRRLRQALSLARNARLRALGSSSTLRSLIDFGVTSTSSSSSI